MMDGKDKSALRARAHALKPVVTLGGAGLSENVMAELEIALGHHELIKVRVNGAAKGQRLALAGDMCARTGAALVQSIGNILVLYRKKPEGR